MLAALSKWTGRSRVSLLLVGLTVAACERSNGSEAIGAEELIRTNIAEDLQGFSPSGAQNLLRGGFPDSIHFRVDTSQAVPGLRYVRGRFIPQGVYDIKFVETAAELDGHARPLNGLAGWLALVSGAGWTPTSGNVASAACQEVVTHALPTTDLPWPPVIYQDSSSVDPEKTMIVEPERSRVLSRVHPPEVSADSANEWTVRLWTVFSIGTYAFECRMSRGVGPLRFRVTVVDSVS